MQGLSGYADTFLSVCAKKSGEGDEGRLRELCEELLGPIRRRVQAGASADADGPAAAQSLANRTAASASASAGTADAAGATGAPNLAGLDGRALLADVLREASRDRRHQRLVSEFQELLAETRGPDLASLPFLGCWRLGPGA